MFYFRTRKFAREFSQKRESYSVVDCGSDKPVMRRWAVKVLS